MQQTDQNAKRSLPGILFGSILTPLLLGILLLLRVLSDSHSEAIRGLDIFRLTGVGFCWGIAFATLMHLIIRPKFRKS